MYVYLYRRPLSEFLKNKEHNTTDVYGKELQEWEIRETISNPTLCGTIAVAVEMLMMVLRSCEYWSAEVMFFTF